MSHNKQNVVHEEEDLISSLTKCRRRVSRDGHLSFLLKLDNNLCVWNCDILWLDWNEKLKSVGIICLNINNACVE